MNPYQNFLIIIISLRLFYSNIVQKHATNIKNQVFENLNHSSAELSNKIDFFLNKSAMLKKIKHCHKTCYVAAFLV